MVQKKQKWKQNKGIPKLQKQNTSGNLLVELAYKKKTKGRPSGCNKWIQMLIRIHVKKQRAQVKVIM